MERVSGNRITRVLPINSARIVAKMTVCSQKGHYAKRKRTAYISLPFYNAIMLELAGVLHAFAP